MLLLLDTKIKPVENGVLLLDIKNTASRNGSSAFGYCSTANGGIVQLLDIIIKASEFESSAFGFVNTASGKMEFCFWI